MNCIVDKAKYDAVVSKLFYYEDQLKYAFDGLEAEKILSKTYKEDLDRLLFSYLHTVLTGISSSIKPWKQDLLI